MPQTLCTSAFPRIHVRCCDIFEIFLHFLSKKLAKFAKYNYFCKREDICAFNDMDKENKLILYKDDEGKISVNTRFADEDVWLTQAQLVEIYQSSKSNISEHLSNIFADKELDQDAVVRKFRTTATD